MERARERARERERERERGVPTFTPTLFDCRDTEDLTHLDT